MTGFVALVSRRGLDPKRSKALEAAPALFDGVLRLVHRDPHAALFATTDLPSSSGPGGVVAVGDVAYGDDGSLRGLAEQRTAGLTRALRGYHSAFGTAAPLEDDHHYVLWDPAYRRLIAAHDQFGVRPLYYAEDGDLLIVASSVRLVLLAGAASAIDPDSVRRFVIGEPVAPGRTYYQAVSRLSPGTTLVFSEGRLTEVSRGPAFTPPERLNGRNAAERFRATFLDAVRRRLVSSEELTALLSGGLDSSAIVAAASGQLQADGGDQAMRTLSLVFDDTPQWSEREYIEAVAGSSPVRAEIVNVDQFAPYADFGTRFGEHGGLFLAPGLNLGGSIYERAARSGARVLLDGHGGDEVVSYGWGRLHDLAQAQAWLTLRSELRGVAAAYNEPAFRMLLLYFLKYGPLRRMVSRSLAFKRRITRSSSPGTLDRPALRLAPPGQRQHLAEALSPSEPVRPGPSHEARQHFAVMSDPRQTVALETLDAAASAAGVSARYPFWDKKLIELCLALPGEEKLQNGLARSVLRRALPEMPDLVRWRPGKLDFSPHLAHGLLSSHKAFLERLMGGTGGEPIWEYVDLTEARALFGELLRDRERTSGSVVQALWRIGALALWFEHLNGNSIQACLES